MPPKKQTPPINLWQNLPDEVWNILFSFLQPADTAHASQVSPSLNQARIMHEKLIEGINTTHRLQYRHYLIARNKAQHEADDFEEKRRKPLHSKNAPDPSLNELKSCLMPTLQLALGGSFFYLGLLAYNDDPPNKSNKSAIRSIAVCVMLASSCLLIMGIIRAIDSVYQSYLRSKVGQAESTAIRYRGRIYKLLSRSSEPNNLPLAEPLLDNNEGSTQVAADPFPLEP